MNSLDMISFHDIERSEQEPLEACPDCGQAMPRGAEYCAACERKRIEFEENGTDPRRPVAERWGTWQRT